MAVAVHVEPHAGQPSVPQCPEAGDSVTSVKRICRIDKEEPSFLFVLLLGEEVAGRMLRALYPSLEAGAHLRIAACVLGLGADNFQDALGHEPAPDLADPD